jgi:NhaA family Na+:H+ antiporter
VVYYLFGMILWVALLKSGVHATLAGVFTALFIPMRSARQQFVSPVERLVHGLHPYVAFMILPVFAFANAGVPFAGMGLHSLSDPVTLGILLGLFIGKPIGIFTSVYLAIRSGLCAMPRDCGWVHIFGMAILCGIGFTMSLFIGGLAFDDLAHQASIRLGVLTGSVLSAMVGYGVLRASVRGRN